LLVKQILNMPGWTRGQKVTKNESQEYRDNKKAKRKNRDNIVPKDKNSQVIPRQGVKTRPRQPGPELIRLEPVILAPKAKEREIIVPIDENLTKDFVQKTKWKGIVLNEVDNDLKDDIIGINEHDSKYWKNGHIWTGPRMVKMIKPQRITHKSIFQNVRGKMMYSRNGRNWYPSWKETFTPEQWYLQNQAIIERSATKLEHKYILQDDLIRYNAECHYEEYGDYGEYENFIKTEKYIYDHDKLWDSLEQNLADDNESNSEDEEWNRA
jgi:L-rhamnose mutarotase